MVLDVAAFQVAPLRAPEGLTLYLTHPDSPWVFRVIPVRDPDQHRLWCLRLEACAEPSLNAITAPFDPFYTSLAMSREQLHETVRSIRSDTRLWLDDPMQHELRQWIGYVTKRTTPKSFSPQPPSHQAGRAGTSTPEAPAAPER